jgi:hypothetical protein
VRRSLAAATTIWARCSSSAERSVTNTSSAGASSLAAVGLIFARDDVIDSGASATSRRWPLFSWSFAASSIPKSMAWELGGPPVLAPIVDDECLQVVVRVDVGQVHRDTDATRPIAACQQLAVGSSAT